MGFDGSGTCSAKNNLQSAVAHPTVVDDYIHHELSLERISGPYSPSMCPDVHINRFGVIPKNYQQDKWRLITDLSYPSGSSVNDGIPSQLCSLTYVTIDDAILNILKSGKNDIGKDQHQKCLSFITSAPSRPISTRDEMERSDIH